MRGVSNLTLVSADPVGRFPDANAAEVLRRVPGVSLEIDQKFGVEAQLSLSFHSPSLGSIGTGPDSVSHEIYSRDFDAGIDWRF